MSVEISEEPIDSLREYASIPIAFEVASIFEAHREGERFELTEVAVPSPYIKDYDALHGEHPSEWARRFDVSRWGVLAARAAGMLEGRRDLAVLWEIRVAPEARGSGVGAALFRHAEAWPGPEGADSSRWRRRT
jgi:GNAT superfamily N-acetyltransferase